MVTLLKWLYFVVFRRSRRDDDEREQESTYVTQGIAHRYSLAAYAFFALQGIVATLGALDIVIPDLPSPINFQSGRAIHLNLSVFWPFIGLMGASFFFYIREAEHELAHPFIARLQFWIIVLAFLGNITALALGFSAGREYLEAMLPFKIAIAVSILLFVYNLASTYRLAGEHRHRPTLLAPLTGAALTLVLLLPNIPFIAHPVIDETLKFWVVHLWEESSLELIVTGAAAGMLLEITQIDRGKVDSILWVEIALVVSGGVLATGHHYYWIGMPAFWHWVGALASFLQVVPFLLLAHLAFWYTMSRGWANLRDREKVALSFFFSSVFYHFFGAGLIGLLMSIPQLSRLTHGTYVTSFHAHLALFGALGLLVLGLSYHILTRAMEPTKEELFRARLSLVLINSGLLIMAAGLFVAGLLQVYLWRLGGRDYMYVTRLVRPYLAIRAAGGAVFAAGDLFLFWSIVTMALRNRGKVFR